MGGDCRLSSRTPLACFLVLVLVSRASTQQQLLYQGILATQYTDRFGLTLREVWDGSRLTQALSSSGEVLACETSSTPLAATPGPSNLTTGALPEEFAWLPSLREDCRRAEGVHTRAKRATPRRRTRHGKNKMKKLRKGRRRDHIAKGKTGHWEESLITPGTKWCGPSNMASRYSDLGPSWEADRCCRVHDQCQSFILGMSTGFNKINLRPFTLSHCSCDRRFRTCLKMAGTTASSFVGKLFFNLVQTKCFVLKTERICTARNWWGKCQKTELRRIAHLRSNMAF